MPVLDTDIKTYVKYVTVSVIYYAHAAKRLLNDMLVVYELITYVINKPLNYI